VFGVLKAIARYDPLELDKPQGCHFHTFLRRVLTDRFKDFIKRLWRIESHYRQPEPRATRLGGGERNGRSAAAGCGGHFVDRKSDPALIVEGNELRARLRETLDQLDDTNRGLLNGLLSGLHLRAAAAELGIPYDAAKRRWRRLRAELAVRLRELSE